MSGNAWDFVTGIEYISNTEILVHFMNTACTGGKFIVISYNT